MKHDETKPAENVVEIAGVEPTRRRPAPRKAPTAASLVTRGLLDAASRVARAELATPAPANNVPSDRILPVHERPAPRKAPRAGSVFLRLALAAFSVGAVAFGAGCSGDSSGEVAVARGELRGDSRLVGYFKDAEAATGVPAELLASVAWVQTQLDTKHAPSAEHHGHDGKHDSHYAPGEWGVMALGTGGLTTLEHGAKLSGQREDALKTDARANVLAAAALLADLAEARGLEPEQAGAFEVVAAYGAEALAEAARRLVGRGFAGSDDEGNAVEVVGSGQEGSDVGSAEQGLGFPGAKWSPAVSGNYANASRGASQINHVVIHTTQGSYSGTIAWFKNPSANVSSHYVVRSSDGQVTQMVDDRDVAYHDGCFNTNSIGIEHEGFVAQPKKWYTPKMYAASAKLTSWLCDKYGIPKDRKHIQGHGETADCSDHTDPGSGWNWTEYMKLVKNGGVDPDKDDDGVRNEKDNCPGTKNKAQADFDGDDRGDVCDGDDDGDKIADAKDNCPRVKNNGQLDTDKDGKGDACDNDDDGDTIVDIADNCPVTKNFNQADADFDGTGDACDTN